MDQKTSEKTVNQGVSTSFGTAEALIGSNYLLETIEEPEKARDEIIEAEYWETADEDDFGKSTGQDMIGMALNDVGNGERFLHLFGDDVLFNSESDCWYIWSGKSWKIDSNNEVCRMAVETYKEFLADVEQVEWADDNVMFKMQRHANHLGNGSTQKAMLRQVSIQRPVSLNDFDIDSNLLSCQNGTLDLATSEIRAHKREDYITKISPCTYDKGSNPKVFLEFLNRIFNGDMEMVDYVQKVLGYFLTGWTDQQCFFIAYGSGANGKSTLIDIVSKIIPEHVVTVSSSALMNKRISSTATPELARTKGARLVLAAESSENDILNEAQIKQMTGGDKIYARALYSQGFEFSPAFKIWLSTNHKPRINGSDNGIWRRIHLIPFDVIIPEQEQDHELAKKLENEKDEIFSWMVEGARKLLAEGLQKPDIVEAALKEYRSSMDAVQDFLAECTEQGAEFKVQSSMLYECYVNFCKTNAAEWLNQKDFSKKIQDTGFKKIKASKYFFTGLKMKHFADESGETLFIKGKIA